MTEADRPLKVFLSYASQDRPLVRELSRRLVGEGWIDTWLDVKKLLPGQDWRVSIEEAVEDSDVVIICLSNHSVTKEGYVQKELRYAREIALEKPEETIFLIPLRLDECEVPRGLRFYQWVDYFGEKKDDAYDALTESLKLRYEQKLRLEEAERARKEKLEAERIAREEAAREKAKGDAEEKARLEAEELARQKAAKEKAEREKAEREAAEKLAREKAEKEAKEKAEREATEKAAQEKARIDAEEQARQNAVREKKEREEAEKIAKEKVAREEAAREKKDRETAEKPAEKASQVKPKGIETQTAKRNFNSQEAFWIIGFSAIILVILIIFFLSNINNFPTSIRTSSPSQPADTVTISTPIASLTKTIVPTPIDLPAEITDAKGVTMRLVPAGEFTMGSENGEEDEKPVHQVFLDSYYIDIYEVTNTLFEVCVNTGACTPPENAWSFTRDSYYGNSQYDDYPVIHVDWNQATAYCEWRDAKLPTEAQWEKAARGTDGRTYPWGEGISCNHANYYNGSKHCVGDTTEVGSYESGKSPYGMYDMAGNVSEWVADWYINNYYQSSLSLNPLGPISGQYRVLRGGSWSGSEVVNMVRSAFRDNYFPSGAGIYTGFRCAKNVNP